MFPWNASSLRKRRCKLLPLKGWLLPSCIFVALKLPILNISLNQHCFSVLQGECCLLHPIAHSISIQRYAGVLRRIFLDHFWVGHPRPRGSQPATPPPLSNTPSGWGVSPMFSVLKVLDFFFLCIFPYAGQSVAGCLPFSAPPPPSMAKKRLDVDFL